MELPGGQTVTLKQQLRTFWQEQKESVERLGTGQSKKNNGTSVCVCVCVFSFSFFTR